MYPLLPKANCQPPTAKFLRNFLLHLHQIPQIPIQILEHSHCSVRFLPRLPHEDDALLQIAMIVPIEIIRIQEQEDPSPCLSSHALQLFLSYSTSQQQTSLLPRTPGRSYPHPSLLRSQLGILHQRESQLPAVKTDGLIIVAHDQCHLCNVLFHPSIYFVLQKYGK
jgi:hypothetical protein